MDFHLKSTLRHWHYWVCIATIWYPSWYDLRCCQDIKSQGPANHTHTAHTHSAHTSTHKHTHTSTHTSTHTQAHTDSARTHTHTHTHTRTFGVHSWGIKGAIVVGSRLWCFILCCCCYYSDSVGIVVIVIVAIVTAFVDIDVYSGNFFLLEDLYRLSRISLTN